VTEQTWALLADHFELERFDDADVKGKGAMTTYLVLGRRTASPQRARLGRSDPRDSTLAALELPSGSATRVRVWQAWVR
jgi:hypothetical protein